jgi:hypothetical protein
LTGQTAIFLSGSFASNITRILDDGSSVPVSDGITLTNSGCSAMLLRLRISDGHFNPMPNGTVLSAAALDQLEITDIFPSSVPNIAPTYSGAYVTGDQGSVHLIPVKPSTTFALIVAQNVLREVPFFKLKLRMEMLRRSVSK